MVRQALFLEHHSLSISPFVPMVVLACCIHSCMNSVVCLKLAQAEISSTLFISALYFNSKGAHISFKMTLAKRTTTGSKKGTDSF